MKRMFCLSLAVLLTLSLSACSMSRFSADALTEAQAYGKAAMDSYPMTAGYEVKNVNVLLTNDLKSDITIVELNSWDVSDVTAVVVVQTGREGEEPTEMDQPLLFLLNQEKKVLFKKTPGGETTTADSGGDSLSDLRRQVAQAQLDAENLAGKSEEAEAFAAQAEKKLKADAGYLESDAFLDDCAGEPELLRYGEALRTAVRLEKRLDTLSDCPSTERAAAGKLLDSDEEIQDQILELRQMLREVNAKLDAQDQSTLALLKEKVSNAVEDPSVLFDEDYMHQCLGSEEAAACDALLRQQVIDELSLAVLAQCAETEDLEERSYLEERNAVVVTAMASYADAMFDYIQKNQTLKEFETAHAKELTDYENGVKEIKERVGEAYNDDIDYIKLQLKYETVLQGKEELEASAEEAKEKADEIRAEAEDRVKELEETEAARKQDNAAQEEQDAFYEYICAMKAPELTEYKADAGQWGSLDPQYVAYQNENLNHSSVGAVSSRGTSSTGDSSQSSSSGSSSRNRSSGSSGSETDSSFEDYLRDNDPDAYESYQNLERNWNAGNWDPENGFFGD